MRRLAFGASVVAIALACGGITSAPSDAGGGDGAIDGDGLDGTSSDAALDAGLDRDTGPCPLLPLSGTYVTPMVKSPPPPVSQGGMILSGTYGLKAVSLYGGGTAVPIQGTLVIGGNAMHFTWLELGGVPVAIRVAFTVGTQDGGAPNAALFVTIVCATDGTAPGTMDDLGFTAQGTDLTLVNERAAGWVEHVYTKQ